MARFQKSFKRTFRRKRLFRKKTYKKRKVTMKQLPSMLRPEMRHLIQNVWTAETLDTPAAPSVLTNILQIPVGTDYDTRTGYEVFIQGVRIKGQVNASTASPQDSFRIDVLLDREPAAGYSGGAALFNLIYGTFYTTASDQLCAVLDPHARQRFKILRSLRRQDISNYINPATNAAPQQHFDMWIPLRRKLRFSQTGTSNPYFGFNLVVMGWSNVASNTPQVFMVTDVSFTDA
nr:MAG: capsid protein [Cressdnaviricota sp.]